MCAVCTVCTMCIVECVDGGKGLGWLGAGVSGGLPGMKYCTAPQCIQMDL